MSMDEARLDAALQRLAREESVGLLAEVVEAGRRDALEILRARFTAALVDEVQRLAESSGTAPASPPPTAEVAEAEVLAAARPEVVPGERAGWYVYGLTWDSTARELHIEAGVDDAPVEIVEAGRIAAVVSPMATTDQWGVRADGEVDLELLAPRAQKHEWVLEQILERGAVLPLRFGVLYPSLEPIRHLLADRGPDFEDALTRLDDHFEWGLTVCAEQAGAPRPLTDVPPSPPAAGRDYLARRRADREAAEAREQEMSRMAVSLHDALVELSADAIVLPATRSARGEAKVVLRASYLVPGSRAEAFRAAAETGLSSAPTHLRLTGELTGPWPAYHFCDLTLEGVTA